jgi:Flp pilus assembly protein TadB
MTIAVYVVCGLLVVIAVLLCVAFYLWSEAANYKLQSEHKDVALAEQKDTIEQAYQRNIELQKVQYENKERQEQLAKKTAAGERDYFEGNSL